MMANSTFIKITNKNIYDRIVALENKNDIGHSAILDHQRLTNGKVKLNRWIATTAMTLVIAVACTAGRCLVT